MHVPCAGETYSAVGGEAWWNGARLPVLTGDAASAGDPFIVAHAKAHLRHRIRYPGKVRSLGSSAYHAALVARGVAEVAILGHVHLWDVAAIGAVLQAVGGCFVYLDTGAPVDFAPLADGRRAPGYVVAGRADTLPRLLPELDARA